MVRRALLCFLTVACAGSAAPRYPLRDPMWMDTDTQPVSVRCRPDPEKKDRRLCRPDEYVSSFAWDGFDNLVTREISDFFAVKVAKPAVNVNAFDEVPDSSWFTNRIGKAGVTLTAEEIKGGPCDPRGIPIDGPDGSILIDQGKMNGANPGFRVRLPDGRKYMMKADNPDEPERATGATSIASRLYHAAGWWSACDTVVYVHPRLFSLKEGLKVTDNTGKTRTFDKGALTELLKNAARRGELVRMAASEWLPGRTIGPFTYDGTRDDDPNDVIAHDRRRDLRGAKVMAAWLNHFDSREQNTMSVWLAADEKEPDSSPGHVRHYYIDLGDCFGSQWAWDGISRRLGFAYYLDFGDVLRDFLTLGLVLRPWDRARIGPETRMFGYYSARDFDPAKWKGGYPNAAFDKMDEADGAWAARIIARFTDEHIAAAVAVGDYTNPVDVAYLTKTLAARRDIIARRFFRELSPVTDLAVDGDVLCGVDLARRSGLWAPGMFRYGAAVEAAGKVRGRPPVTAEGEGRLCVTLTHVAADGGVADDHASRYVVVTLTNGQAPGKLRAFLYDLGPARGFKLVGIERASP